MTAENSVLRFMSLNKRTSIGNEDFQTVSLIFGSNDIVTKVRLLCSSPKGIKARNPRKAHQRILRCPALVPNCIIEDSAKRSKAHEGHHEQSLLSIEYLGMAIVQRFG